MAYGHKYPSDLHLPVIQSSCHYKTLILIIIQFQVIGSLDYFLRYGFYRAICNAGRIARKTCHSLPHSFYVPSHKTRCITIWNSRRSFYYEGFFRNPGSIRSIAANTEKASRVALTSCTRTTLAPYPTARRAAATLACTRLSTAFPVIVPSMDLRESPAITGHPMAAILSS